jgi:hypothetical protein
MGSFVGKHANFCATVRAWHIRVKRVACTKDHSVDGMENGNTPQTITQLCRKKRDPGRFV